MWQMWSFGEVAKLDTMVPTGKMVLGLLALSSVAGNVDWQLPVMAGRVVRIACAFGARDECAADWRE